MRKPLTKTETAWRESVKSGQVQANFDLLRERQALSLDEKINLSFERIREWYEAFDGMVSVSFSGGKDSAVLLWLVRQLYPDVPACFVNTGLEYPEIVRLVKSTPNTEIIRPKMPFHKVIQEYGWPVVSKKVARGLSVLRHPTDKNKNIYGLYDRGVNRFGEKVHGFRVPNRWRFLVDSPFEISDKCCNIMKKQPVAGYIRKTGRVQYLGTLADESKARQKTYLQYGCNAFDLKMPRSTPMAFWTEQNVLEFIVKNNVEYASVYGEIIEGPHGFELTGVHRTGCVFCCFGLHLDEGDTRIQRLYRTHPKLWSYCMNRLGLAEVLQYMHDRVPDHLRSKFKPIASTEMQKEFKFAGGTI